MEALLARRNDDRGFTLIELMVVVLIIGILIAIAIPSFFGARKSAQDTATRADLRNGLTAAKVWWAQNGGFYDGFDIDDPDTAGTDIAAFVVEPSLPWVGTASCTETDTDYCITITSATGNTLELTMTSKSLAVCTAKDEDGPVSIECVDPT